MIISIARQSDTHRPHWVKRRPLSLGATLVTSSERVNQRTPEGFEFSLSFFLFFFGLVLEGLDWGFSVWRIDCVFSVIYLQSVYRFFVDTCDELQNFLFLKPLKKDIETLLKIFICTPNRPEYKTSDGYFQ